MNDSEKFPSQLAERFQVRLPDGMRDRLKAAAEANKRPMNTEIVARLEDSLAQPGIAPKNNVSPEQAFAMSIVETVTLASKCGVKVKITVGDDDPEEGS